MENEEVIQAVGRDYIDVGAVKQETVIENVEGDVYLVRDSDIDWDTVAKAVFPIVVHLVQRLHPKINLLYKANLVRKW